jgi:hypothetical protein
MRLGGEERIKDTVYAFSVDARSRIYYCYPHTGRRDRGNYVQHSFPVDQGTHRLDSIHDQVSEHQLQLDPVAGYIGKLLDQFGPNRDLPILNFVVRQP